MIELQQIGHVMGGISRQRVSQMVTRARVERGSR